VIKRTLAALVVVVVLVTLCGLSTLALAAPRNPVQEAAIDEAVSAVDPQLVSLVHEGNAAMDRGDLQTAVRRYTDVHAKAPEVAAITRRLCTAETRTGDARAAINHCREAVAKEPGSAENHAALVLALLSPQDASPHELSEARQAADDVVAIAPETELAQSTTCALALRLEDAAALTACSAKLRDLAPDSPQTHLYTAFALADKDDFAGARRELDLAHTTGLEQAAYDKMRAALDKRAPPPTATDKIASAVVSMAPIALGIWVAIIFVLVVVGMLLSDAAMGEPSQTTRAMCRFFVLAAIAMFYVSATIGVLLLVAAIAFVAVVFLSLIGATRPVDIAFGVVGAYLLVAMIRALLGRVEPSEIGTKRRSKKKDALRATLDAITKRLRMDPIDEIYVVPGAELEVREIGGVLGHLRGKNPRALVIGVFAMGGGLGTRAFGAVVTSELVRYRSEGSAGGDVAIVERDAIRALVDRMHARGVATIANPAWWFVSLYRVAFERITEGAVDYQQRMADARAAKVYGSKSLVAGIRHLAKRGVEIEARAAAAIHDAFDGGEVPEDVYARDPEDDIRTAIDATLEEIAERQKQITALKEDGYDEEEETEAWSLFADREAVERAMNDRLRAAMRERIGLGLEGDQPASSASAVARA
jgi:hypothetical protein